MKIALVIFNFNKGQFTHMCQLNVSCGQDSVSGIVQRDQQGLKLLAAKDSKIFPKYKKNLCVSVGIRCKL
jgi:hypothetical protein